MGSGFVYLLAPSGAFGNSQSLRGKRNLYLELGTISAYSDCD